MHTANRQAPKRSPITLLTPRPLSANREDHCDIANSLAPAQIISTMANLKPLDFNKTLKGMRSSSLTMGARGTFMKLKKLNTGISAQSKGRTNQRSVPKGNNNSVDIATTATCPQQ